MDRLTAIRGLSTERMGTRPMVKGVWQTLQRTPLRQWLSLELPRCYVAPTVRTWTPQEWRDVKKDARLVLRDSRKSFVEGEDRRRLQIHSEKVNQLNLTFKTNLYDDYVKRDPCTSTETKAKKSQKKNIQLRLLPRHICTTIMSKETQLM